MSTSKDTISEAAAAASKKSEAPEPATRAINEILRDLAHAHAAAEPMSPYASLWLELRDAIDTKKK